MSDNGKYELRCGAPNPKDRTRTCGKFLGSDGKPYRWVGSFEDPQDDDPNRLSIRCPRCHRYTVWEAET